MSDSDSEPRKHVLQCRSCNEYGNFVERGHYINGGHDEEDLRYVLLRCPGCGGPMLATNDYAYGPDGWEPMPLRILYPEPYKQVGFDVPPNVRKSYEEAVTCLSAACYVASSIMCRRTLEAVTNELLKKPKPLAGALRELGKQGVIDPQLLEWADALRVSGNKAAHEVGENVSKQDAQDVLEFSHALIEYAFTYKRKFEEFKARSVARAAAVPEDDGEQGVEPRS
jgi:hypothetical protein